MTPKAFDKLGVLIAVGIAILAFIATGSKQSQALAQVEFWGAILVLGWAARAALSGFAAGRDWHGSAGVAAGAFLVLAVVAPHVPRGGSVFSPFATGSALPVPTASARPDPTPSELHIVIDQGAVASAPAGDAPAVKLQVSSTSKPRCARGSRRDRKSGQCVPTPSASLAPGECSAGRHPTCS